MILGTCHRHEGIIVQTAAQEIEREKKSNCTLYTLKYFGDFICSLCARHSREKTGFFSYTRSYQMTYLSIVEKCTIIHHSGPVFQKVPHCIVAADA